MDTCTCIAESLCCSPETITRLIGCTPTQNKKLKENQGVRRASLEALGDNLCPCLYHFLKVAHIPWLLTPSSVFKASNIISRPSHIEALTISSVFLFHHLTTLVRDGTPLHYSCLENPMDRGAWKAWHAAIHGSLRVRHDWVTSLSLFTFIHWRRIASRSSVLAWRIPGMGKPGELLSMGLHRVGHNWSDLAAAAVITLGTPR